MPVNKPRNANTWTEAKYWQIVRSALRRAFRYWKPATDAKMAARREYTGKNKRQKYEYQCAHCSLWFKGTEVQIDHKIPVGSLKSLDDLAIFLTKLTPEEEHAFQCLCKPCHLIKTKKEREK